MPAVHQNMTKTSKALQVSESAVQFKLDIKVKHVCFPHLTQLAT